MLSDRRILCEFSARGEITIVCCPQITGTEVSRGNLVHIKSFHHPEGDPRSIPRISMKLTDCTNLLIFIRPRVKSQFSRLYLRGWGTSLWRMRRTSGPRSLSSCCIFYDVIKRESQCLEQADAELRGSSRRRSEQHSHGLRCNSRLRFGNGPWQC